MSTVLMDVALTFLWKSGPRAKKMGFIDMSSLL